MPENTPATWATRKLKQLTSVSFRLFSAAGDRIRPILWSPEIKRPKTEPSFSKENIRAYFWAKERLLCLLSFKFSKHSCWVFFWKAYRLLRVAWFIFSVLWYDLIRLLRTVILRRVTLILVRCWGQSIVVLHSSREFYGFSNKCTRKW